MSASQRRKGMRGENEAASLLTDHLGYTVKRKLGQARDGGDDLQVGNIRIEVKRQEKARLYQWLEQVNATCEANELAAVMWRPSRRGWVVCMDFEDWCELVREAL